MLIEANSLSLKNIRHGFFTRQGGVSGGLYATLMAGSARATTPPMSPKTGRVWRPRLASSRKVFDRLSDPFATRGRRRAAWTPQERPRADGIVTRTPASRSA